MTIKLLTRTALCAGLIVNAAPAPGMAILDSTFEAAGGSEDDPHAGFADHLALAAEDPFTSAVKIEVARNDGVSTGSGVWIGEDLDGNAIVLTAAHVVQAEEKGGSLGADPEEVAVTTSAGETFKVSSVMVDPEIGFRGLRNDQAILTLDAPASALAGTRTGEPLLFCGDEVPAGTEVTLVGYGTLGIGSEGKKEDWGLPEAAVAVRNVVDGTSADPVEPWDEEWDSYMDETGDFAKEGGRAAEALYNRGTGNMLVLDFDGEDGETNGTVEESADLRNFGGSFESSPTPVDKYEGRTLQGDSGGPAFAKIAGSWVVVGLASFGGDPGNYGSTGQLVRPGGQLIFRLFPTIKTIDEDGESCSVYEPDASAE